MQKEEREREGEGGKRGRVERLRIDVGEKFSLVKKRKARMKRELLHVAARFPYIIRVANISVIFESL